MRNLIGVGLIILGGVLTAVTGFAPLAVIAIVGVFLFASFLSEAAFCDYIMANSNTALVLKRYYIDFLPLTLVSYLLTFGRAQLKIIWREEYFKTTVFPDQEPTTVKLSRKDYIALRNEQRRVYSTQVMSREFMESNYSEADIGLKRKKMRLILASVFTALSLTMLAEPGGIYLALAYTAVFLPMVLLWIPAYKDAKILHEAYTKAMAQPSTANSSPVQKPQPSKTESPKITSPKNHEKEKPDFASYPQKYVYCRDYVDKLDTFFEIDCLTNDHYHYIALDAAACQLIEIHTRVVGLVKGERPYEQVLDFVNPPREITIDEFITIAENKYEGIRIFYHGINQNNLSLYKDMARWYWHNRLDSHDMTELCQTKILYQFEQSPRAKQNWERQSEIYPLVAISEFLVAKGFTFERASVGGGITEISHCGTLAYSAAYTSLADFRDNFKRDVDSAHAEAAEEYQGWASIDYRYISVTLTYGNIELRAEISGEITMAWHNIDDSVEPLIDETNQKMISILGDQVELRKRYYIES